MIRCIVPPFSQVQDEIRITFATSTSYEVPLSLVRDDGVIYSTGTCFTYTTGVVPDSFTVPIPPNNPNIPSQLALPIPVRQLFEQRLSQPQNGRFVSTGYTPV